MEGWIKLHRKLLEWEWYSDTNAKVLFLHCLLKANIKDCNWKGMPIKRGQFFSSYASLSTELGLSIKEIRSASKKLEKTGELTLIGASNGTMITVCNYASYQHEETTKGKPRASDGQAKGKPRATDREEEEEIEEKEEGLLGDKPPKKPKQPTKKFIKPTIEEIQAYCLERQNSVIPSKFFNYYESNGWKVGKASMKDWKAAVRTWETNNQNNTYNAKQPKTKIITKTSYDGFKFD